MKKVVVFLADGFEEIEAISVIDYLRRAELDVTTVAIPVCGDLTSCFVTGAHGVCVKADSVFDSYLTDCLDFMPEAVVIPGGMPGAANIGSNKKVISFIQKMNEDKKLIAAICAAPVVVLSKTGVLKGKKYTCYPGMEEGLSNYCGNSEVMMKCMEKSTLLRSERVIVDGTIITSKGPGSAEEFSMAIIKYLCGEDAVSYVKSSSQQR